MKKGTLIIGSQASGKTEKANELVGKYLRKEVEWIDPVNLSSFHKYTFSQCRENTKLIVLDEVESKTQCEFILGCLHGIKIDKRSQAPFIINPHFIVVIQSDIFIGIDMMKNFINQFDIIDCDIK
jgi:hypothetical protein